MYQGIFKINPVTGRVVIPGGAEDELGNELGGDGTVILDHTYEGDGTNDRLIDLGDDYDQGWIFMEEVLAGNVEHMALAHWFEDTYGVFENVAGGPTRHHAMSGGSIYFKGKDVDPNKINVGGNGAAVGGCNTNGRTYRIVAYKYAAML
jgi:hypothetical protein